MNKITPTLFALSKEEFQKKYEKLQSIPYLHIDFMDGKFTQKQSLSIREICDILKNAKNEFDIHLMAYNPIKYLDYIKRINIKEVLIQIEVFENKQELSDTIDKFHKESIKVCLAINPQTNIQSLIDVVDEADSAMFMGVVPGKEGQELIISVLNNIRTIRKLYPQLEIKFDGGIKKDNIKEVLNSGANTFGIGSAISSSRYSKKEYKEFEKMITQ